MTESNVTQAQEQEQEQEQELVIESHAPYLKVFLVLAVFTAMEYGYARILKDSFTPLVVGLVVMAVIKAGLVGWFFMHLKFEGRWVYALLIPAAILAVVVVLGLVPDIAYYPGPDESETPPPSSALIIPPSGFEFRA